MSTIPSDERIAFGVLVDGVDVTSHVDLENNPPTITSELNETLDTLALTLRDSDGIAIRGWNEIVVNDLTDGTPATIFGGYNLTQEQKHDINLTKNVLDIGASDYAAYLDKVFFQGKFDADTQDAAILAAVFAACPDLAAYDASTYVTGLRTIPRSVFNKKSVKDIISWLETQTGANWYIDYQKNLHYFGESEFTSPFQVVDDALDSENCLAENVVVNEDASGVCNLVELIGGNALSGDKTYKFTPAGNNIDLWMNKKFSPWDTNTQIVVRRNDGGPTTNLIVNPSFETNITDGWTQAQSGSGAAWAQDTAHNQGAKSLKITAGTATAKVYSSAISLAPGEALSAQVMAYVATAGKASVVIYDATNLVTLIETVNRKTSSWERLTATYINTSAASISLRIELRNNAVDSSTTVNFDAVQAEKLAWPTAYCDGSLGTGYAWTGTAHNSTSTRVNMPVMRTLTVKTGNSDTLGGRDEVLYFESEGKLEQETYWPALADAVEVDGQEETPVHVVARNFASYQFYGMWFQEVITDSSIVDPIVARMRCATELAKYAMATQVISFDVRRPGLRSGQTLAVSLPVRNINGSYLVQKVTTTIGIGGHITAHVELGAVDKDLVKLILKLNKATTITDSEINTDEVINHILDFSDIVEVIDDGAVVSHSQGPYLWGTAIWGYSRWG